MSLRWNFCHRLSFTPLIVLALCVAIIDSAEAVDEPGRKSELTRQQASEPTSKVTWRRSGKNARAAAEPVQEEAGVIQSSATSAARDAIAPTSFDIIEPLPIDGHDYSSCDACGDTACIGGCANGSAAGPYELWVRAEYLLWSLDGAHLPPLITTSPVGTAPANIGRLDRGARVLFGDDKVADDARSGGRATIGFYADASRQLGFEASYLGISQDSESFTASSADFPNLARPVFDTGTNSEAAMIVASSGTISGNVSASVRNDLQVAELLSRQLISGSGCDRFDWLIGYRHGRLDERLRIDQSSTFLVAQGPIIPGTTSTLFDLFETENRFHGAEFGLSYRRFQGPWTVSTTGKLGVGVNRASVTIDGSTTNTVPGGGSGTFVGGLLAQSTNIGHYSQSDFAVMPEVGFSLIGNLNRSTQVSVGYSLLYWSVVARAAEQVDRRVSQFPPEPPSGTQSPQFQFETDGFFAHGLNAGLLFQF